MRDDKESQRHLCFCVSQKTASGAGTHRPPHGGKACGDKSSALQDQMVQKLELEGAW